MASSVTKMVLDSQKGMQKDRFATAANIIDGGQQGYMPDLANLAGNQNYVRKNTIAILLQAPEGFQDLPDPVMWVDALKALVERHATRIEGLRSTLNVEWVETVLNGAGEMQQDVGNVTRERSEPAFTWPEKRGKPVKNIMEGWILNLLGDPVNKIPMVVTRGLAKKINVTPQYTGMTVLFIEPDVTHREVVEAWLCTNMMPNTSGPIEGSRDISAGGENVEVSVTFSAVTQYGYGVRKYAQKVLDSLNLSGVNPNLAPAFASEIDAEVQHGNGYAQQIKEANSSFLKP